MNRYKCFLMTVVIISFSLFFSVIDSKAGTVPEVDCVETVNPHGNTIPPAGSTTLPGPMGGQNEDGFYELIVVSGDDVLLFVEDQGSGAIFGPFLDEDKIKYTEAPGATPSAKTIGSTMGQAGAIEVHIIGTGEMGVFGVDASGNQSSTVFCLVPPPPK